jgi:hypothetical protein
MDEGNSKDTDMPPPTKTITCTCGYTVELQGNKDWCDHCGRPVFCHPGEQTRHRISTCFITLMLILSIGVLTYFFIELVMAGLSG